MSNCFSTWSSYSPSRNSTNAAACAFIVAFVGSVAMWWIYFKTARRGAERGRGSHHFTKAEDVALWETRSPGGVGN